MRDRLIEHDRGRRIAVVERGGVDERLERGARLAQRLGGAVELGLVEREAADHRQHAAGERVHRDAGAGDLGDLAQAVTRRPCRPAARHRTTSPGFTISCHRARAARYCCRRQRRRPTRSPRLAPASAAASGAGIGRCAMPRPRPHPPAFPPPRLCRRVPPSGPRSMIQSAVLMTSRLCSITSTVLPRSTSRCSTSSSTRTSSKCRPVVGSSRM